MLRFLTYLFGAKDYEPCKSCETLKQQLDLVNAEKKELTATLLNLINPKVVEQPVIALEPMAAKGAVWARRKAALEEEDRRKARTLKESKFAAVPGTDTNKSVEELEKELGIPQEEKRVV